MPMVSRPLLGVRVAGTIERKPRRLVGRPGCASLQPVSCPHGEVMVALGKVFARTRAN